MREMKDMDTMTQQLLARFAAELRRQCNRVVSDERTHREHPSYITKTIGREHLNRLNGAVEITLQVLGTFPDDDTARRVHEARHIAASWL